MALSNVTTAVSDGGTSGGKLDMDINAESFYIAYKTIENVYEPFDSLSSAISSISAAVSALGVNFSSISKKIKTDSKELSDMCVRMKAFKTTLEKVDSSNALLFAEMDLTMFENFGEDMSETDQALYIEKCTMIYNLAVKKAPEDLTELEKNIIENLGPYMKLNEYIDAENKYNEVNAKYEDLNSQIYNLSRSHGALGDEDTKKLASLVKERDALKSGWLELKTNKESLRSELIDMGVLEMTAGESLESAGKQLLGNFTNIFSSENFDEFRTNTTEFLNQLGATGSVIVTDVAAGIGKVTEYVIDGAIMVGAGVASAGTGLYDGINAAYSGITGSKYTSATKSMWNKTMDLISNDTTGDIYNSFYQTSFGKMLNDASALKYDSAGATAVKDVSIKATEVIATTAVTVATGGAAAPFVAAGIGFLEGTGKTAEERFSAGNREAKDIGLAFLGGVGKAGEWYGYGQAGAGVYNGINNLKYGISSNPFSNMSSTDIVNIANNKNVIGTALEKTFTSADVYVDLAGAAANTIATKITTGKINLKESLFDFGFALGGNIVGDVLGEIVNKNAAKKYIANNPTINVNNSVITPITSSNPQPLTPTYSSPNITIPPQSNNITTATQNTNAILGTNITKDVSFKNMDSSLFITDVAELQNYPGNNISECLQSIAKQYGENSPQYISARATALQLRIDFSGNSLVNLPGKPSDITYRDTVINHVKEHYQFLGDNAIVFSNAKEAENYFSSDINYWKNQKKLASDEYSAMKYYTGVGSTLMNGAMRTGNQAMPTKDITNLYEAISKSKLNDDVILFRGIPDLKHTFSSQGLTIATGDISDIKRLGGGQLAIVDNAFSSSTPLYSKGFTHYPGYTVEVIRVPKGTECSFVGNFSTCPGELETILQAGSGNRQIIEAVEKIGNQTFVYTTIVN